jgi:hypothetical protein
MLWNSNAPVPSPGGSPAKGTNKTKIVVGLLYVLSNQIAHIPTSHGSIPDATTFILFQHLYQGVSIMVCLELNKFIGKRSPHTISTEYPQPNMIEPRTLRDVQGFSLTRWNIDSVNYLACLTGYVSQIQWSLHHCKGSHSGTRESSARRPLVHSRCRCLA